MREQMPGVRRADSSVSTQGLKSKEIRRICWETSQAVQP